MTARLVAIVGAVLLVLGVAALPAQAHVELTGSTPADGATLPAPPAEVVLTFSETPLPEGLALVATDGAGDTTRLEGAVVEDSSVVVPWPADASAGTWRVAFRVVADDGHPIEGAISFTIAAASPSPSPSSPSPTSASATSASATSASASPASATTTAASPSVSPSPAADGAGGSWPLGLVIGAAALIAVVVAAIVARGRRGGDHT